VVASANNKAFIVVIMAIFEAVAVVLVVALAVCLLLYIAVLAQNAKSVEINRETGWFKN